MTWSDAARQAAAEARRRKSGVPSSTGPTGMKSVTRKQLEKNLRTGRWKSISHYDKTSTYHVVSVTKGNKTQPPGRTLRVSILGTIAEAKRQDDKSAWDLINRIKAARAKT